MSPSRPAAALVVLLLAACSAVPLAPSPTDPLESVTTTTLAETVTTISSVEGTARFRECLSGEGLEIDPIPLDAQGRPRLDLAMRGIDLEARSTTAALDRCGHHLVTGALAMGASPVVSEEVLARLSSFSRCVRARGVSGFPDPVPGFQGVGFPYPAELIPYDDPDLIAAIETCRARIS